MSIRFYTRLKAWRQAKQNAKRSLAEAPAAKVVANSSLGSDNATVYAAGIACAGQIGDRAR